MDHKVCLCLCAVILLQSNAETASSNNDSNNTQRKTFIFSRIENNNGRGREPFYTCECFELYENSKFTSQTECLNYYLAQPLCLKLENDIWESENCTYKTIDGSSYDVNVTCIPSPTPNNFNVTLNVFNCTLCDAKSTPRTTLPANVNIKISTSSAGISTSTKTTNFTTYDTSSNKTDSPNSNNNKNEMISLPTSKPTQDSQKNARNETTQLLIGIIVSVGIVLIIVIIILIICVRRKLRKAVDTNSEPIKFTQDNYDKTMIDSELPSNIYQQINETSDQSDHYHRISTLGSDTSQKKLFNDKRSLLVSANHFEGDNSSDINTAGQYFLLEKDSNSDKTYTTDKDDAGSYFVLEEREMLQNTNKVQDINSSDDITTSSQDYSKLGQIERQTNDEYGMLSNSNKVQANKTNAPYEMAKSMQTTQGTISSNQGDIQTSTLENDSSANYFVLESDCSKTQDSESSTFTLPSKGYAKLGEISRQINDSYGVLSNVNSLPSQKNHASYEKAKVVENPQDNYCLASTSSNPYNGCISSSDTSVNYFVLESNSSGIENEVNDVIDQTKKRHRDEINSYSKLKDVQELAPHVYDIQELAPHIDDVQELAPHINDVQELAPHVYDVLPLREAT